VSLSDDRKSPLDRLLYRSQGQQDYTDDFRNIAPRGELGGAGALV